VHLVVVPRGSFLITIPDRGGCLKVEPEKRELEDLKKEADRVLFNLRNGQTRDPLVIEFAGSPKAGKSTCIDILTHFLKRSGFKVWAPTEGASKRTPYHLKRDLVAFNTWTLNYAISEMLVAYYNVDHHDLIILDRGPFDSLSWMSVLLKMGRLKDEELKVYESFAIQPRWFSLIKRVYLFTCEPSVSLKRETESKLTEAPGTAMNPKMLEDLLGQYVELEERHSGKLPLLKVSTSDRTTPRGTAFELANDVLKLFAVESTED
jgi:predicted ATPase